MSESIPNLLMVYPKCPICKGDVSADYQDRDWVRFMCGTCEISWDLDGEGGDIYGCPETHPLFPRKFEGGTNSEKRR